MESLPPDIDPEAHIVVIRAAIEAGLITATGITFESP